MSPAGTPGCPTPLSLNLNFNEKKGMILILRPGEAFLKSERVKRRFEGCLLENIRQVLAGISFSISRERGRIYLETNSVASLKRLQWVPGITSISPAIKTEANPAIIIKKALALARKHLKPGMSFAVRAKCVNQSFSARWLEKEISNSILSSISGVRVDLSNPSFTLEIEVRGKNAYLFYQRIPGVGGLPVGSGGKVSSICTGRPEEVIATWFMLKRGCLVSPVIFSPRLERVVRQLKKLHQPMNGFWVPSAFKRTWREHVVRIKVAGELGRRAGSMAIVLADWLESIDRDFLGLDEFCSLPVLRPLVGMSAEDLKSVASTLGLPFPSQEPLMRETLSNVEELSEKLLNSAREVSIDPYG